MINSGRVGLMSALAAITAISGFASLPTSLMHTPQFRRGKKNRYSPKRGKKNRYSPKRDHALQREIAAHNEEVDRRKAEKKADKRARRATQGK